MPIKLFYQADWALAWPAAAAVTRWKAGLGKAPDPAQPLVAVRDVPVVMRVTGEGSDTHNRRVAGQALPKACLLCVLCVPRCKRGLPPFLPLSRPDWAWNRDSYCVKSKPSVTEACKPTGCRPACYNWFRLERCACACVLLPARLPHRRHWSSVSSTRWHLPPWGTQKHCIE